MPIRTFLATLYPLYIFPRVAFWLVVLGAALQHTWSFLINLINGICNLILRVALCVRLSGSRLVINWFFSRNMV